MAKGSEGLARGLGSRLSNKESKVAPAKGAPSAVVSTDTPDAKRIGGRVLLKSKMAEYSNRTMVGFSDKQLAWLEATGKTINRNRPMKREPINHGSIVRALVDACMASGFNGEGLFVSTEEELTKNFILKMRWS